jgi:hypothetical protein
MLTKRDLLCSAAAASVVGVAGESAPALGETNIRRPDFLRQRT